MQRDLEIARKSVAELTEKSAEVQQALERERIAFAADKKVLEDLIVERTNSEVDSRGSQLSYQNEIRSLEERLKVCTSIVATKILINLGLKILRLQRSDIHVKLSLTPKQSGLLTASGKSSIAQNWLHESQVLPRKLHRVVLERLRKAGSDRRRH